jgi:hypothetical protein
MRYWQGHTKDNKLINEKSGEKWTSANLKSLQLVLEDIKQTISLPENLEYIQSKTASADMSTGKCDIESRNIGFKLGSNIVMIKVDEKTSNITIAIE